MIALGTSLSTNRNFPPYSTGLPMPTVLLLFPQFGLVRGIYKLNYGECHRPPPRHVCFPPAPCTMLMVVHCSMCLPQGVHVIGGRHSSGPGAGAHPWVHVPRRDVVSANLISTAPFTLSESYSSAQVSLCRYLLVALYLEQVLPSPYGTPQHLLFFIPARARSGSCCRPRRRIALGRTTESRTPGKDSVLFVSLLHFEHGMQRLRTHGVAEWGIANSGKGRRHTMTTTAFTSLDTTFMCCGVCAEPRCPPGGESTPLLRDNPTGGDVLVETASASSIPTQTLFPYVLGPTHPAVH